MSARILKAVKAPNGYHFHIHLDTEMVLSEEEAESLGLSPGEPDPRWLHDITFGPLQPSLLPLHEGGGHNERGEFLHACTTQHGQDLTEEQYLENMLAQLPDMIELELHRRRGTSHHDQQAVPLADLSGKEL